MSLRNNLFSKNEKNNCLRYRSVCFNSSHKHILVIGFFVCLFAFSHLCSLFGFGIGGKSDVGFIETLQRSSPNDDVYVVRVLSEGDGEKKTVDEIFEKYDKMRQLCEKNQR